VREKWFASDFVSLCTEAAARSENLPRAGLHVGVVAADPVVGGFVTARDFTKIVRVSIQITPTKDENASTIESLLFPSFRRAPWGDGSLRNLTKRRARSRNGCCSPYLLPA
jgi:hypothetical protein